MLRLFSPAKINLFLKVLGKRPDGYHELSSLFQTIDLGDFLTFSFHSEDSLTCTDPVIPIDESNLISKAIHLFRRKTGIQKKYKVHLEKNVPIQAGLGGGSSNAATTLWALNQLSGHPATTEDLQKWSAEIGSDIPFFFSEGTAYCTGRGEHVQSLLPQPSRSCWIIKPSIGLSTPEVYKRLSAAPLSEEVMRRDDLKAFFSEPYFYVNDLEKPAFALCPPLSALKDSLKQQGFDVVMMTGSGSAFFCLGDGRQAVFGENLFACKAHFRNRKAGFWY